MTSSLRAYLTALFAALLFAACANPSTPHANRSIPGDSPQHSTLPAIPMDEEVTETGNTTKIAHTGNEDPEPDSPAPGPSTYEEEPAPTQNPTVNLKNMVKIETIHGEIIIELNEEAAPQTVANFKKLAKEGFYDGTTFHRVIPGFMIQGGDPLTKDKDKRHLHGTGGTGYTIPAEIRLLHKRGSIATARKPDEINPYRESNGSQFFICVADAPHLDGEYTCFGHVVSGMDVVDKIVSHSLPCDEKHKPLNPITMNVKLLEE